MISLEPPPTAGAAPTERYSTPDAFQIAKSPSSPSDQSILHCKLTLLLQTALDVLYYRNWACLPSLRKRYATRFREEEAVAVQVAGVGVAGFSRHMGRVRNDSLARFFALLSYFYRAGGTQNDVIVHHLWSMLHFSGSFLGCIFL